MFATSNKLMILNCFVLVVIGCSEAAGVRGATFHENFGWKAEDYFTDPQVIALCKAIEANDLKEMDRLIAAGANVNAKGKDNMTPLLWAFPDNKLDRFKKLLEHGADPNVAIKSDLHTRGGFDSGESVSHLACKTNFPGYFEAVFAHGGDPNLIMNGGIPGETPLFSVVFGAGPNKKEHVQRLIDMGADVSHIDSRYFTPTMSAVSWFGQFDIALLLLNSGADYKTYMPKSNRKLIHFVAGINDNQRRMWSPKQAADYEKLVKWLEDHGQSIEVANADFKRWESWHGAPGDFERKMEAEVAERKAAEKKAATDKHDQKNSH